MDLVTIGYIAFTAGLLVVGGTVIFRVWKTKHPYKIRVRRLTGSNTKVIRDAIGKKKVDKKGIEYIKAYYGLLKKPLPNKLPIPSADVVEYDSWNLTYTGRIHKLGPKTISVDENGSYDHISEVRIKRMNLYEFVWRNYNFDVAEAARSNHETMMYI